MNFLISHTYNGQGMSESDIHILDSFSNYIKSDVEKLFLTEDMQNITFEKESNSFYYNLDDDDNYTGRVRFQTLPNNAKAVALFPNVNEIEIINDNETLAEYIKDVLSDEYNEDKKIFNYLADVEYDPNYLMLCTLPEITVIDHYNK